MPIVEKSEEYFSSFYAVKQQLQLGSFNLSF